MNEDCLKLTTYFGERQRTGRAFLADAQLDLFGSREIAISVLLRGDISPLRLPEDFTEATKLTVYVGRQERVYRVPAFAAVCDLLRRRGIAGATVLLGVDGTAHGKRTRARFFGRNADVPMMIIAVGSGDHIGRVLPELGGLLRRPLITLERVQVRKRDGELLEAPHALPTTDEHGMAVWQKLMVYTSERAVHGGQPVHRALVRRLRESGARGATVAPRRPRSRPAPVSEPAHRGKACAAQSR